MAQKHRFNRKSHKSPSRPRRETVVQELRLRIEPKPPVQYGKAFVLLEDVDLKTFEYVAGAWIPYGLTIRQCRSDCLVKELPQKVNGRTRYEVRSPLSLNP